MPRIIEMDIYRYDPDGSAKPTLQRVRLMQEHGGAGEFPSTGLEDRKRPTGAVEALVWPSAAKRPDRAQS